MSDFLKFANQEEDDDIVCDFGPAFFAGARFGAGAGGLGAGVLCGYTYYSMLKDQREADAVVGLKRGQVNKNFSSWVVLRGFRTQPMLASGCVALALTTVFKSIKYVLASKRCYEFYMDDLEFEELERQSRKSPELREELSQLVKLREEVPLPEKKDSSFAEVMATAGKLKPVNVRRPTYMDGVAVGFMGSILDCWVPQKPMSRYYNMCAGF